MVDSTSSVIAQLVPLNPALMQPYDLKASDECVTIGRNANCDLVLPDQRCSSNHCRIWINREESKFVFEVEDLSTNGTYVNNSALGKGNKVAVQHGDDIVMLHEKKVGADCMLGFKFTLSTLKRRQEETPALAKRPKLEEVPAKSEESKDANLSADLECGICTEVIHQCVTLMPCLHNVSIYAVLRWMCDSVARKILCLSVLQGECK